MARLKYRNWVPELSEAFVQRRAQATAAQHSETVAARVDQLAAQNRQIYQQECFNLNPATNVMNPRAEALLSSGMGTRPSLGYSGDKYEMGLEAIEEIEVIAAQLCAEVFNAQYAEIRVASGAMANLYNFMALTAPGDDIIVPPATIGGHATHHVDGCAGLFGLFSHNAPIDHDGYSVNLPGLAKMAARIRSKLINIGGSLNLFAHPVREIRQIADNVGAKVLFDAAHQCRMIAGRAWATPPSGGRPCYDHEHL